MESLASSSSNVSEASQDTMVASICTNVYEELESYSIKYRDSVVTPEGFLITPLHVVKFMAESFNTILHVEVITLVVPETRGNLFRVELMAGCYRGIGQAPYRKMAIQAASIDMLEKIQDANREMNIPKYALPVGCRISPQIFPDLRGFCRENHLTTPTFTTTISEKPFEEEFRFEVTCTVGQLDVSAKGDNRYMVRRMAASKMYLALTGEEYPLMGLAMGKQCIGLVQLRQIGVNPVLTPAKKEWLKEFRTVQGRTMSDPLNEPNDGILLLEDDNNNEDTATSASPQASTSKTHEESN